MATLKYEPAVLDLEIRSGDDFIVKAIYTQAGTDQKQYPVDLTNVELKAKARVQYNIDADYFDIPLKKDDKEMGAFIMTFSSKFTSAFRVDNKPKKFIYDVQSTDANGFVCTFMVGTISFTQDVTY